MTTVVRRIGDGLAVVIPKPVAREMQLSHGMALDIGIADGALVMRKEGRRPRRSLKTIVAQIKPDAYRRRRREFSDQGRVGKEIW